MQTDVHHVLGVGVRQAKGSGNSSTPGGEPRHDRDANRRTRVAGAALARLFAALCKYLHARHRPSLPGQ